VNWFRRLVGKDPEYEIVQHDIPLSTVLRWYLYDTELVEPNSIVEELGLSLVSEEGDAKEREDSDLRIKNVAPLYTFLDSIADISANVLTSIHLKELKQENEEAFKEYSEEISSMNSVYKAVALSTLLGAFSISVDLGIVDISGILSDVIDKENDNG